MTACVSPARMVRSTPARISFSTSSATTETCRSLISRVAICPSSLVMTHADRGKLRLDRRLQALAHLRDVDLQQDLVEEPANDKAPRGVLGNSPRLQVEQLLVVEPAGGARVPGALDLSGLDLQVGHRVRPRPVGEHQVPVELEGVRALGG